VGEVRANLLPPAPRPCEACGGEPHLRISGDSMTGGSDILDRL